METAIVLVLTAGTANAAVWSSTDRWGTWTSDGYTRYVGKPVATMNKYGAVGPLGSLQTTATVGGHS